LQSDLQDATENPVQQVQQDYAQLASALQNGNLAGAQSAFAALQQALQTQSGTNAAATTTSAGSNDPIANDLTALGQALSSGNLTQSQSAFSQLQNDIQAAPQSGTSRPEEHHHHHGGGDFSPTASYTSSNSTTSAVSVYA
jgi:hypothetical protein